MNSNRLVDLQNFEVKVDPKVWKSIEAVLDGKRKRRMFFILLIAGIALSTSVYLINALRTKNTSELDLNLNNRTAHVNQQNEKRASGMSHIQTDSNSKLNSSGTYSSFPTTESDHVRAKKSKDNLSNDHINKLSHQNARERNVVVESGHGPNSVNSLMAFNSSKDQVDFLPPLSPELFAEENPEINLVQKDFKSKTKTNISRWSIIVMAGISHNDSKSLLDTSGENAGQLKSIDHVFYSAFLKYDLSLRFAFSLGVSLLQIEQKRSGMNSLYYPPNSIHPENYDMSTALGTITGNATEINQALFGHDTSFSLTFSGSIPDTTLETEMKIREQFQYIQIPVEFYYKLINRKVSPFLSASFNTGILTSNSIYLNDVEMQFNYNEKLSHTVFSAGLGAGTSIQICRRWNVILQLQIEKQLSPVLENEIEWKPIIFKAGGGVGFRF